MSQDKPIRRHPFLWLTGLLLAVATLWVGYFLATFDLNLYRERLASELGTRLQMPVRLGEAHLELREAGIALRFNDLQIGTEQAATELQAPKVWLQLAWHGLLLRKPILTEVALDHPQLRITTSPSRPGEEPLPSTSVFDLELLSGLQIKRFEVSRGSLSLNWQDHAGATRALALSELNVELGQLGLNSTVTFNGTGNLASRATSARLAVKGSVALPATGSLRDAAWDASLEAKGLDVDRLAGLMTDSAGVSATGIADLELFIKGTPAREVTIQANLSGTGLSIKPGPAIQTPVPLKHLQVAGTWLPQAGLHHFRQVTLQFNDLRLAGELSLRSGESGHQLVGKLSNSTLPLDTLRQWVPPALQATNPVFSRRLPGGLITLSHARFSAEIPADPNGFQSFSLDELRGEARALSWDLGGERTAELKSLGLRLEDNRWHLEGGTGTLAGLPTTLSATIFPQSDGQPQFSVDLAISGPAGQFVALQSQPLPAELTVAGDLSLKGHLAGTPSQYTFEVRADLAQLATGYGEHLQLPLDPGNHLSVRGQGTRSALTIEQGTLALAPLAGRLTGTIDWTETPTANLSAQVELADLANTYAYTPAIAELQLQGGVALAIAARGPLTGLQPEVALNLINVGIPTHGMVADITQLNGRLLLEGKGLRSDKLAARLGKSPVNLSARVADFATPRLELDVQSASIRADELIFHSDRSFLRDIDGRLIFDRDGLLFAPVKVSLDGGTRATVSGSVKNFDDPRVDLDITGEYANVKEIIGLWTDESPAAESRRKSHHAAATSQPLPPIRITVDARSGDLYGMKFANAKALIVPTTERLLIHPLDFNVGAGYCTTQVLVDYSGRNTILRTSGHVENVDAYEIVNELLDRKSIMRGSLRGDFYLQGELGDRGFLPTSFGNINATVRDGVMRHSPVLSTVFSLLNVSQLFSFKLPDVNREGVPFTRLAAELAIDKGILSSDLIVIDSEAMNMSYIGKFDMVKDDLDLLVVTKPLGTIDKVVTRLPIAGWILGGDEKALITAQFRVTGPGSNPDIEAIPISALSKGVLGLFQRALSLPLKLIDDPAILWGGGGKKN
jgi:uncharacterized protein YhdP